MWRHRKEDNQNQKGDFDEAIVVGAPFEFWLEGEDQEYDEIYGDDI